MIIKSFSFEVVPYSRPILSPKTDVPMQLCANVITFLWMDYVPMQHIFYKALHLLTERKSQVVVGGHKMYMTVKPQT